VIGGAHCRSLQQSGGRWSQNTWLRGVSQKPYFVCETAHTSIGGSDRRLGPLPLPLPLPCQAPRHRQPVLGSGSPDPAHAVRIGSTGSPASSSNESSARTGIDPLAPAELPRGCVLVVPPELAQRGPVLTAPRRPSWLGRSQRLTSLGPTTADDTPRCGGQRNRLPIPLQQSGGS